MTRRAVVAAPRSAILQHPERAVSTTADVLDILTLGLVAHVGFTVEAQPYVIPMSYHFDPNEPLRLYLHGSHQSRLLTHLATGAPVCVTVTLLDGLVFSRTAKYHSINYRSVMLFGRAAPPIARDSVQALLEAMIARYHPGRVAGRDYEPIPDAHLDGTGLIAILIEEWSAKSRNGGPKGPRDGDPLAPGTAGVVPLASR